jgi:hypothetical protein
MALGVAEVARSRMSRRLHTPDRARLPILVPVLWLAGSTLALTARVEPAAAQASLTNELGRPVLEEARFIHQITMSGAIAVVESSQVISNPGKYEQEAIYTFDLPVRAAVTGLEVRLADGRTSSAAVVDAQAAVQVMPDPDSIDAMPDVGLLRLVARDRPDIGGFSARARATYELRVSPVPSRKIVTTTVTWMAPLEYADGRLSLRIPERGSASNLVRERVELSLQAAPTSRGFGMVHGGGRALGKGIGRASFIAPARSDLTIEAALDFGGNTEQPLVSFAAVPLTGDTGAIGLSVLNPNGRGSSKLDYRRVLLLVDVSRSMDSQGLRAAARLADAFLASLAAGADVEVIVFDRRATRVFGSFVGNGGQTRKRVAKALEPGTQENGSDLGQALELARRILESAGLDQTQTRREWRADTLVVLLSDGMVPLALDSQQAIGHLGSDILAQIEFFPLVLVPDSALMPDLTRGVLAELAGQTSVGRAIAVRVSELDHWVKHLSSGLTRPAPLTHLRLESGDTVIRDIDIPYGLEPGQGLIAVGTYHGGTPNKLLLRASRRDEEMVVTARRTPGWAKASAPLALAVAAPEDFLPVDIGGAADQRALAEARRQLVRSASHAGAVTEHSSLVALAGDDRFARDRLGMVQKWGPASFMRLPPPSEREFGAPIMRTFQERTAERSDDLDMGMRTGELDGDIIQRLLSSHVVPKARACYEKMLRGDHRLTGSLVVVVEVARGEVQYAAVERSSFPATFSGRSGTANANDMNDALHACVIDAAYGMQVPRVALGDDPETINVARYPLRFKPSERGQGGAVESGTYEQPPIDEILSDTEPLSGLPAGGGNKGSGSE